MEAIKAEVSRTIARLEEQADAQWARCQGQGTTIEKEFLGHLADCVIRKFVEYSPEDYRYFVFQTYNWIHRNYGSRVRSEWAASVKPRIGFYAPFTIEEQQRTTDTVTDYREDKSAVGPQIVINSNNVADGHETTDVDMEQSSMVIEPAAGTLQSGDSFPSPMPSFLEVLPPSDDLTAEEVVLNDATPLSNQEAVAVTSREDKLATQPFSVAECRGRHQQEPNPTSFGTPVAALVHPRRSTAAADFPYDPGIHGTIPGATPGATQARKMSAYKADEPVRLCDVGRRRSSARGYKLNDGRGVVYPVTKPEGAPRQVFDPGGAQHTVSCSAITPHHLVFYPGRGRAACAARGLPSHTWFLPVSG